MFFGIVDIWTFVAGAFFIVLLPGPNSLYILSLAAQHGVRQGYRGAMGVILGDTVLMVLVAAGAASLLRSTPLLFNLVKYAGAAYLVWIGAQMLRSAWRSWRSPAPSASTASSALPASPASPASTAPLGPSGNAEAAEITETLEGARAEEETVVAPGQGRPPQNPFFRALLISLMNPKAILFFVSFFIQFVDPGYPAPALSFLILGVICQVFSVLYLSTLIFGGTFLAVRLRARHRVSSGLRAGVGALFIGFGARLATGPLG